MVAAHYITSFTRHPPSPKKTVELNQAAKPSTQSAPAVELVLHLSSD
jgi:hypothetical protein